jgi:hypothetical protein
MILLYNNSINDGRSPTLLAASSNALPLMLAACEH